jgi:hypothetical protein
MQDVEIISVLFQSLYLIRPCPHVHDKTPMQKEFKKWKCIVLNSTQYTVHSTQCTMHSTQTSTLEP